MSLKNNKYTLRNDLKTKRDQLENKDNFSEIIQKNLINYITNSKANKIISYSSIRSEPDTTLVNQFCLNKNLTLCLPYSKDQHIIATQIKKLDELKVSNFGIKELDPNIPDFSLRKIDPQLLDIIIVPGLGFDESGNRIGYGKGFYDKFLPLCKNAIKIGICFEALIVKNIPTDKFDQKIDLLITELRILKI